jgi:hypothetical protein
MLPFAVTNRCAERIASILFDHELQVFYLIMTRKFATNYNNSNENKHFEKGHIKSRPMF